jgi:2-dehydro-3-deoxygluconokinase
MMKALGIKPAGSCQFDMVALGEVMLRLDPGEGRVRTTRNFHVWEGGGEYNVARGLRRCFGLKTAICTALADNEVGRLIEDCILQGGVETRFIRWAAFDGVGRRVRNGLNFTERGYGVRGAVGVSDRGHSAASQLKAGDFDWDHIFGELGVRWFHTGGIFAGLSGWTGELARDAMAAARKHGTVVSYDLNYRPSLWQGIGGLEAARKVNRELACHADVLLGNEEDFTACLGLKVEGLDAGLMQLEVERFAAMLRQAAEMYGNLKVVATTLRRVKTATLNDWGAICWADGKLYQAAERKDLEVFDRVGGGDSFASGLIYGFIALGDSQAALEYGAAHGALAMTTPGDNSMASLKEVEDLVKGGTPRVKR